MRLIKSRKPAASQQLSLNLEKPSSWYAKLWPEQKDACDWILERISSGGGVALFAAQRTGKTYITCAVIEWLNLRRILIIAPRTAIDVTWKPAIATFDLPMISDPRSLAGAPKFIAAWSYREASQVTAPVIKRLLRRNVFDLVVFDESQGIKARNSDQSRAARRFRHATRRLALSGTPIDASPIDVFAQMRFVDYTVLGEDWRPFANKYCYKGGFQGHKWIFARYKLNEFLKELSNHIYRLTTDFMSLKPVQLHLVPVMMLGEQDRMYRQMEEHGIVQINSAIVTGSLPITKLAKLEQITGGSMIGDDNSAIHHTGYAKQRKLRWLMSRLNPPIVIFCKFIHELAELNAQLTSNYRVAALHGKVKGEARVKLIDDFQRGEYDILIAQLRTGSVSVSFTRSSTLVIYSMNHSYIDFEQLMARLQGMTQEREVQAYLIYCQDTVDETKLSVIREKASTVYQVVSAFERR